MCRGVLWPSIESTTSLMSTVSNSDGITFWFISHCGFYKVEGAARRASWTTSDRFCGPGSNNSPRGRFMPARLRDDGRHYAVSVHHEVGVCRWDSFLYYTTRQWKFAHHHHRFNVRLSVLACVGWFTPIRSLQALISIYPSQPLSSTHMTSSRGVPDAFFPTGSG